MLGKTDTMGMKLRDQKRLDKAMAGILKIPAIHASTSYNPTGEELEHRASLIVDHAGNPWIEDIDTVDIPSDAAYGRKGDE